MKSRAVLAVLVCGIAFAVLVAAGCGGNGQSDSEGTPETSETTGTTATETQEQQEEQVPAVFAITYPKDNATVGPDVITVRGTGAQTNTTVEVDVFTDAWYPQSGTAQIGADGSWAYSPCYLKGQGASKEHHNIRARLMKDGQQIDVVTVYDIAVE